MYTNLTAFLLLLLNFGNNLSLAFWKITELRGWVVPQLNDVIFDTLGLAQFPVPSLSKCLVSCSQDARCVSVFYQKSRGQCRLQGGRFYLAQGGRKEQGWRYYLLEMDPRCPARTGYIHRRDLSLCYRLEFQVAATQPEAVSNCTKDGGHLLRIDSQEKRVNVEQQLNSSDATAVNFAKVPIGTVGYYIDGQHISGLWVWSSNGQQMTFSNWAGNEGIPGSPSQSSVTMSSTANWKWISTDGALRSYICEIDVSTSG